MLLRKTKPLLVFCEIKDEHKIEPLSLEILGLALELANTLKCPVHTAVDKKGFEHLKSFPLTQVFTSSLPSNRYCPDRYVSFLEQACKISQPTAILLPHSALGQDIAPRLASRLKAGLLTDVVELKVEKKSLIATKPIQGGVAFADYSFSQTPAIMTIRARVGKIPEKKASIKKIQVMEISPQTIQQEWEIIEQVAEKTDEVKLEDAEFIISGGRGIGGAEGFELLKELARLLNAGIGASRPACDAGWVPSSCQVGITGKIVRPQVYIAVGISGSSQHLVGMSDAETIIAINKDPEAYIFKVADYGIIGDYQKVIPAMIEAIKKFKGKK